MWVRKRLDLSWRDLLFGLVACRLPRPRAEPLCPPFSSQRLVCLSVRSGLDLLLEELALPRGSEVLVSALTIPDMVRIVEAHGLTAIPVDLDLRTAGPTAESLRRAISPRSRAILVAHLFGGRFPLGPVVQVARERGLFVIEDCAQAFDGRYAGSVGEPPNRGADASLFSFGPIKTATALGGAVVCVRDAALLGRLQARHAARPVQGRGEFARRALKYGLLKAFSSRGPYGLLVRACRAMGIDHDRLVNGSVRGFPGGDFFERIRRQPAAPLVRMVGRRLRTYDHGRLARRTALGEKLASLLGDDVVRPGYDMQPHSHWVFPVLVENPEEVIAALRKAGFDATQGQSMAIVRPPEDRPELFPCVAAEILAKTVYLPIYPEMTEPALPRMLHDRYTHASPLLQQ
jgi:dTDP-4-amino-4,6-dideoxygalactose transaminase